MTHIPPFGLPVPPLSTGEIVDQLVAWAGENTRSRTVGYLNAHTVNLAQNDADFATDLRRMDLLYADGMSVVRAWRSMGVALPERVSAGDFLPRFLWAARTHGLRVGLVGSEHHVVEACAAHFENAIPGWRFCLVHDGHFAPDSAEEAVLVDQIRHAAPHVLLVGMGSPRQERWVHRLLEACPVPVAWCVGALFEYYGGRRRAPVWMRRTGLEWLFRFALEPRRLARRYLIGNMQFLAHVRAERRRMAQRESDPRSMI